MTRIAENTFAAACYDMNSLAELRTALAGEPDAADMAAWSLTEDQWRAEIQTAIAAKEEDAA